MKKLVLLLTLGMITCFTHSACTQNSGSSHSASTNTTFKTNLRADGSAFYAFNSKAGSIQYMLDYGDNAGKWRSFGQELPANGGSYSFDVLDRFGVATFYAIDNRTGQLYYTDDVPETVGIWKTYGNTIRKNGVNALQFEATGRASGNSFYAYDSLSGQMYFMNDFGQNAGVWTSYGNQAAK